MKSNFSNMVCLYHPTSVFLVDDNRNFLETIELILSSHYNVQTCTNPERALTLFKTYHDDINKNVFTLISDDDSDTAANHRFDLELGNLFHLVYEKKRFDSMSVVVVDYAMPEMHGIEFCRRIKDRKIHKIMLTAEDDKSMAIQAFNDGLIDRFILKDDPQLQVKLVEAIDELQKQYFECLSKPIMGSIAGQLHSLFSDIDYKKLFNRVYHEKNAVEYYMVDAYGSFLFLDSGANPTWLIMRDKKALDEQLLLLNDYDVPAEIMESLKKQESMLCLVSEVDYKQSLDYWIQHVYPVQKLNGNYYYALVDDKLTCSIAWDKVIVNETVFS